MSERFHGENLTCVHFFVENHALNTHEESRKVVGDFEHVISNKCGLSHELIINSQLSHGKTAKR